MCKIRGAVEADQRPKCSKDALKPLFVSEESIRGTVASVER